MHQYLKSIGFGNINSKKKIKEVLDEVEKDFSLHDLISSDRDTSFCEYRKDYGNEIGISVCGEADVNEKFERDYYFPYFKGSGITSYSDIIVERRIEKEEFIGICEDVKVGVSIIFHLLNSIEYKKEKEAGHLSKLSTTITLSGLALGGTVLFPIMKNEQQVKTRQEESRNRMLLLSAAKNGDQTAIESLTLEDIDTYSKVSQRLITEDIFSIVDTYFMPYGVECDQYSILGEILEFEFFLNDSTKVELVKIKLEVNELVFDICVPKEEVIGEIAIGRRFKTNIWLQGYINFPN